jgi:hypothetical protein
VDVAAAVGVVVVLAVVDAVVVVVEAVVEEETKMGIKFFVMASALFFLIFFITMLKKNKWFCFVVVVMVAVVVVEETKMGMQFFFIALALFFLIFFITMLKKNKCILFVLSTTAWLLFFVYGATFLFGTWGLRYQRLYKNSLISKSMAVASMTSCLKEITYNQRILKKPHSTECYDRIWMCQALQKLAPNDIPKQAIELLVFCDLKQNEKISHQQLSLLLSQHSKIQTNKSKKKPVTP